jgi:hypothetical protein
MALPSSANSSQEIPFGFHMPPRTPECSGATAGRKMTHQLRQSNLAAGGSTIVLEPVDVTI